MEFLYCWTIGDWSDDGHGELEKVNFYTNTDIQTIRDWYIEGCNSLGVAFHAEYSDSQYELDIVTSKINYRVTDDGRSINYSGVASIVSKLVYFGPASKEYTYLEDCFEEKSLESYRRLGELICLEEEGRLDSVQEKEEYDELCDNLTEKLRDSSIVSPSFYVILIMEMISRVVYDDFEWKLQEKIEEIPSVNGYWKKGINMQIGYEIFMERNGW